MRTSVRPTQHEQRHAQHAHHLSMHWERRNLCHILFILSHMHFMAQVWVSSIVIDVNVRFSLSSIFSSVSTCHSLSFSLLSTSCTSSCPLSSTTWSPCKTCATPPRGVTTLATSTPASHVMRPIWWPSASSTTHRVPSSSWSRHRTRTWTTWHSASCSQKHTEDKPITAIQKACQSVSRRLSCSIEQGNLWETNVYQSIGFGVTRNTNSAHSKFF